MEASSSSAEEGSDHERSVNGFRVCGIGASAGGLESLEELFANLATNTGMAFVIIQHLSPDFRSMMDELLARHTSMPIRPAQEGMLVEPDHVFLLPPRMEMRIEGGRLWLRERDPTRSLVLPIDSFFTSLASDFGKNSVAVVLSGSGSDGSRGVLDVKRAGGLVLCESPESARFDGMPGSALASGAVDFSSQPATLARVLNGESIPEQPAPRPSNPTPMEQVIESLRRDFGTDFGCYKRSTVERRIARRAEITGHRSLRAYARQVREHPDERRALYRDLLIGVTQFFRDPEAFAEIARRIRSEILEASTPSDEIRVWVAGCATGEEAYSIAMILCEELDRQEQPLRAKILATDIDRTSLEFASIGVYPEERLANVSPERREAFFRECGDGRLQVEKTLRQMVVFAPHDVMKDAPFTRLHMVSCRNLLIYFTQESQRTALSLFHFGLNRNGLLFLGSSESPGSLGDEFRTLDEHNKIYSKRRDVRLLSPMHIAAAVTPHDGSRGATSPRGRDDDLLSVYDQLLDRHMPPGLLIGEDRRVLDTFGGAERWLRLPGRRPSTNVLDLLEGELRTIAVAAIQRVLKSGESVRYHDILLGHADTGDVRGTLTAELVIHPRTAVRNVMLYVVESEPRDLEPRSSDPAGATEREGNWDTANRTYETLEGELSHARETLQAAIEELQTSNEELQSTNEELVASNEELQSTNEELHSVNEELFTVNAEYQQKIVELNEANNDIQHLLEGTDVATLFLDSQLLIRKYTPQIADVFNIHNQDVGRSITDFSHRLVRDDLWNEIERVRNGGDAVEDEVRDRDGRPYFLRILPYQATGPLRKDMAPDSEATPDPTRASVIAECPDDAQERRIAGVVLTLTDISSLDRTRAHLRHLSAIVESSDDAILAKTLDGTITSWNQGAEKLYGYTSEEAVGRNIRMLAPPDYRDEMEDFFERLHNGDRIDHVETVRVCKDGRRLDVSVTISPMHDATGKVIGASAIARDITQLKRAQRQITESSERLRLLLDSTAEAIFGVDTSGHCTFCNPACARALGYESVDALIGKPMLSLMARHEASSERSSSASPHAPFEQLVRRTIETGEVAHSDSEDFVRINGTPFAVEYWIHPVRSGEALAGAVVTFLDITDRREAQEEIVMAARRREQFLAMLSHELRNPLSAVLNATRILQSVSSDHGVTSQARAVIDRQSQHMARLVDDLLDVARITRGGLSLRRESIELGQVIHASIEELTAQLVQARIELLTDLSRRELWVDGDPARLQQVIANLISNAARYSPAGSRVWLSAHARGRWVEIAVRDEGDGIPRSLLPRIFDLFVQSEQGLDRAHGGLGVGLTLVREIVDRHGGTVTAESDGPGKGSEFVVRLPLRRREVSSKRTRTAASTPTLRVLVVEDQSDSREMLRILLERKGHRVSEAADGPAALDSLETEWPDAALIDIGLPQLSGYDVAKRVRALQGNRSILLVALTGYGRDEDVRKALEAGFDHHVTKPIDPDALQEILRPSQRAHS